MKEKIVFSALLFVSIFLLSSCANKEVSSDLPNNSAGGLRVLERPESEDGAIQKNVTCPSAEFVWNEEAGVCARSRDLQNEDQMTAVKLAVGLGGSENGLLVLENLEAAACAGCYLLILRSSEEEAGERIIIRNWKAENSPLSEMPVEADSAENTLKLIAIGEMQIIPEFVEIYPTIIKWKNIDEESELEGRGLRYPEGQGSREVFVMHQNVLDKFASLGFAKDELNSKTEEFLTFSGFTKDSTLCLVIMSEAERNDLDLRCTDI